MNCLDLTGFRRQSESSGRDLKKPRRLAEVQPRFDPVIGGFVNGNAVNRQIASRRNWATISRAASRVQASSVSWR